MLLAFELPVALGFYITSQLFGLGVLICVFIAYQQKSKMRLMVWFCAVSVLALGCYAFLQDWVLTGLGAVSLARSVAFLFIEKYRAKTPKWLSVGALLLFMAAALTAVIITWNWWLDWVIVALTLLLMFGMWHKNIHLQRIFNVLYSAVVIAHFVLIKNYIFIAVESTVIISVAIFYFRRFFKKRNNLDTEVNKAENQVPAKAE